MDNNDQHTPPSMWDNGSPRGGSLIPLQQYINDKTAKGKKKRAQDIATPQTLTLNVAQDTTAASWNKLPWISTESLIQLTSSGLPLAHAILITNQVPNDSTFSSGAAAGGFNASGQGFLLGIEQWYAYIPSAAGDGLTITAVLWDVSSELPAQTAQLAQAVQNSNTVTTVQILNRSSFKTDTLVTAATFPGTAVQYGASVVIPNSFAVAVVALPSNTKNVYLGYSNITANVTHGVELSAGMSVSLSVTNWNLIWISSDVGGEGVSIVSEI